MILVYTVFCNEADNHTEPDVEYSSSLGELWSTNVEVSVAGNYNSVVVTGLIPYTVYECHVTASTSIGQGNTSLVVSAQTDESGGYCNAVVAE